MAGAHGVDSPITYGEGLGFGRGIGQNAGQSLIDDLSSGTSSSGRAKASQALGDGFESRVPLHSNSPRLAAALVRGTATVGFRSRAAVGGGFESRVSLQSSKAVGSRHLFQSSRHVFVPGCSHPRVAMVQRSQLVQRNTMHLRHPLRVWITQAQAVR